MLPFFQAVQRAKRTVQRNERDLSTRGKLRRAVMPKILLQQLKLYATTNFEQTCVKALGEEKNQCKTNFQML